MTTTATATPCTDEQKAEWSALHDKMSHIYKDKERAEHDALHYLARHVEAGAMTPGPFGLPSRNAVDFYTRACEAAAKTKRLWAEWQALHEESKAHPYTAELEARRDAR